MKNKLIFITTTFALVGFLIFTCSEKRVPFTVKTHPDGWIEKVSENYHGKAVLATNAESCKSCHGNNFSGGTSKISCASCHELFPHPEGLLNVTSENFHGKIISQQLAWDVTQCKSCHGVDYSGGETGLNCMMCHTDAGGPEACNVCHGNASNAAPPEDLMGNEDSESLGIGFHQLHLTDTTYTTNIISDCQFCHIEPNSFNDEGHIDASLPSELVFNTFVSDSGLINPIWDRNAATCSNIYCHGGFVFNITNSNNTWGFEYPNTEMKGNNPTLSWIPNSEKMDDCNSCHGMPPTGHIPVFNCDLCHGNVVNTNNDLINRKLHINGKVDLQIPSNSLELNRILKHLKKY